MKTFEGMLEEGGFPGRVIVTELTEGKTRRKPLRLRLDLSNHSPDGFSWGYAGSGPAQLALALLAEVLGSGNGTRAIRLHQRFKFDRICALSQKEGWTMTDVEILAWVAKREFEEASKTGEDHINA